jgi:PKD repeat protein
MPDAIQSAVKQDEYSATLKGVPDSGDKPLNVAFTLTETGGNGTAFVWNFGDGGGDTPGTSPTISHTYTTEGTYSATVTVTVDGAQKGPYTSNTITVNNPPAQTNPYSATLAGEPLTGTANETAIVWTLTETNKPDNATASYEWDLGDSSATQTTNDPTISYTYKSAGSFSAKCTPTINSEAKDAVTAAAPAVIAQGA